MNNHFYLTLFIIATVLMISCKSEEPSKKSSVDLEANFIKALQKHLNAVSDKDLTTLKSTLSPKGNMELLLPSQKLMNKAEFIEMHADWFKDTTWTFDTKIISSTVGSKIGVATIESMYKEPERNGKPYFNKMHVSYTLENIDGNWFVIKDHACSIEKTQN